jgi:AAA family ATP:ADP antiporter
MRAAMAKVLGVELRPGEGLLVALFALDLFLLLTAYYVLKVVREPLILLEGGAVHRSYARGFEAVVLLVLLPGYSFVASRSSPRRVVDWVSASFIAALLIFWVALNAGLHVGFAFFVWLGIFSTLSIAQFWSLSNDLFTEAEGKRLFPVIAVGGTVGGIAGAQIAARASASLSPGALMLVSAGILVAYIATTASARRLMERRAPASEAEATPALESRGGFRLIVSDRYLLLIGVGVLALNLINTTGEYVLAELVTEASHAAAASGLDAEAAQGAFIARFYGDFQTWVSVFTTLVQLFFVARIFRIVGVHGALLFLPVFALGGYAALTFAPSLLLARFVKIIENGGDYSLQNTIHQTLFLPTSRAAKYKAKAATDTLFVRLGDLASTGLVFVGTKTGLALSGFALVNSVVAALWVVVAVALARLYRRRSALANGAEPLP